MRASRKVSRRNLLRCSGVGSLSSERSHSTTWRSGGLFGISGLILLSLRGPSLLGAFRRVVMHLISASSHSSCSGHGYPKAISRSFLAFRSVSWMQCRY